MCKLHTWLEIQNVDAWLDNRKVFSELNLNLNLNENTVILGPNGSGKSALIKLIERSIYPVVKDDSFIKYLGNKNPSLWDMRRDIGFVSHDIQSRINSETNTEEAIGSGYFGTNKLNPSNSLRTYEEENMSRLICELSLNSVIMKSFGELSEGFIF